MLNPSWKADFEKSLRENESYCLKHMDDDTFEEQPFLDYFINWECYFQYIREGYPDTYDARNLGKIAEYYNSHTNTCNYYNPHTGVKGTQTRSYSSNSDSHTSTSESEKGFFDDIDWKTTIIGGVIFAAAVILLLRSCGHAEDMTDKYVLVDKNNKKIEFSTKEYQKYDINNEVINPSDFPIKAR